MTLTRTGLPFFTLVLLTPTLVGRGGLGDRGGGGRDRDPGRLAGLGRGDPHRQLLADVGRAELVRRPGRSRRRRAVAQPLVGEGQALGVPGRRSSRSASRRTWRRPMTCGARSACDGVDVGQASPSACCITSGLPATSVEAKSTVCSPKPRHRDGLGARGCPGAAVDAVDRPRHAAEGVGRREAQRSPSPRPRHRRHGWPPASSAGAVGSIHTGSVRARRAVAGRVARPVGQLVLALAGDRDRSDVGLPAGCRHRSRSPESRRGCRPRSPRPWRRERYQP